MRLICAGFIHLEWHGAAQEAKKGTLRPVKQENL